MRLLAQHHLKFFYILLRAIDNARLAQAGAATLPEVGALARRLQECSQARLEELYPFGQSASELEQARREGVGALAPASVACLMVKLALRAIQRRTASSALYHLDLSVPEMERFDWAGKV